LNDQPRYVRVISLKSSLGSNSWEPIGEGIIGALSVDGKTIAAGVPYDNGKGDASGHVRVYRLDGSGLSWMPLGEDIAGEAAGNYSGTSVSLSANGKTVAIGSPGNEGCSGQVRVFVIK
jgi:hypothetical protein